MGSYNVSEAKMNVMLIFLVLCIRYASNYFFKASNGIWWPVFVTVLHLKDCRKLSFSRVTCCFDWSSSHFDSWISPVTTTDNWQALPVCLQNFVFSPKKNYGFPLYQYQLTGFWNKNCYQCDKRYFNLKEATYKLDRILSVVNEHQLFWLNRITTENSVAVTKILSHS